MIPTIAITRVDLSRCAAGVLTAVALSFTASGASAQEANKALAEELFRQGQTLMQANNFAEACPKFAESQRLDPGTGTLFNLAVCHERQGKLASAWVEFSEALAMAQRDGRQDRVSYAEEHLAAIEPKLSRLKIELGPGASVPGLEVQLDGATIGGPALGVPVPVDAGSHRVTATAPGKKPWNRSIDIPVEPRHEAVTIPALVDAPAQGAAPTPVNSINSTPMIDERSSKGSGLQKPIGIGLGVVGVVGLGIGTYFGVSAISKNNDSNEQGCSENLCTSSAAELRRDARFAGNVSTVAFIAGGVALAGGAVLYFTAPKSRPVYSMRMSPLAQATDRNARLMLSITGGGVAIRTVW